MNDFDKFRSSYITKKVVSFYVIPSFYQKISARLIFWRRTPLFWLEKCRMQKTSPLISSYLYLAAIKLFFSILGSPSFDWRKNKWWQWRKRIWPQINSGQSAPTTSPRGLQQTQRLFDQPTVPIGRPCSRPGPCTLHSSLLGLHGHDWLPTPSHHLFTTQWGYAHPTLYCPLRYPSPSTFSANYPLITTEQQSHSAKFQLATKLEFRGAIQTGRNFLELYQSLY